MPQGTRVGRRVDGQGAPLRPWQRLRQIFVTGVLVLAPLVVTIFVSVTLFRFFDELAQPLIWPYVGRRIPGLGVLITVALVLAAGLFATNFLGRKLVELADRVMDHVPLLRTIYSATRQVTQSFLERGNVVFERPVFVPYPGPGSYTIGFQIKAIQREEGPLYVVFMPFFPGTSGILFFLEESQIKPCPMTVEEAIRTLVSGGTLAPSHLPPQAASRLPGPERPGAERPGPARPEGQRPGPECAGTERPRP